MFCSRYKRLLVPYVECELDERGRARVESHVLHCPRCAQELELVRAVSGALRSTQIPAMEPAPDLWAKVSARIERETTNPANRGIRLTQTASVCAAVVLAVVVGASLIRTNLPPETGRLTGPAKHAVEGRTPGSKSTRPPTQTSPPGDAAISSAPLPGQVTHVASGVVQKRPAVRPHVRERRPLVKQSAHNLAQPPGPAPAVEPEQAAAPAAANESTSTTNLSGIAAGPARAGALTANADAAGTMDARSVPGAAAAHMGESESYCLAYEPGAKAAAFRARSDYFPEALEPHGRLGESVVDALNETEGVRTAALFTYP